MVNPTGYTALDMIGFTDKGPYASSANYVKNDLVHYSGNIWRCLIDDTSGIAPAEGVNWTLFIGEPTNLVERIIAPVETDPATSAWAVGRQIIFNDNLYEVITAITAGDALVAYEDDPTNANIKLADPVETQLLNVKGNLSNRNLLDNAWFTVNQRGQNSYTTTWAYTVDRWKMANLTSVTVNDGSITLSRGEQTSNQQVHQIIDNSVAEVLDGKQVTISIMLSDGSVNSKTGILDLSTTGNKLILTDENYSLNIYKDSTDTQFRIWVKTDNTQVAVKAVKLELGSVSTLVMDTAPNYAEELLKCMRYFYRPINGTTTALFQGINFNTTSIRFGISLPTPMRTTPTITHNLGTRAQLIVGGALKTVSDTMTVMINSRTPNMIVVAVDGFTGLTADTPVIMKTNNAYINLSADL